MPINKEKMQPPRGMRDFMPKEMRKRLYVLETINQVFEEYGFQPFESPAIEHWEILAAKGGDEIETQIYKFKDKGERDVGLRFDLTVPISRVVASNPTIRKPFKRYCTSRVWRYERPQTGRFREFWQADIDIFGVPEVVAEVELISAAISALRRLKFTQFSVQVNHRKLLSALITKLGVAKDQVKNVFRAIDKLDRKPLKEIEEDLGNQLDKKTVDSIIETISIKGPLENVLDQIALSLGDDEQGVQGIKELRSLSVYARSLKIADHLTIDFSMVRGLDYYTGIIYEIRIPNKLGIGSVAGGGRYDKMVESFGGKSTPAVGISLGIERILEFMESKDMFPPYLEKTKVMITALEADLVLPSMQIAETLRGSNIPVEFDLLRRKLPKVLSIADQRKIGFVVIIGKKDFEQEQVTIRNMKTGEQQFTPIKDILKTLSTLIRKSS
ncbi:MAG: histidine--tRNA ligase [Candidatus Ranarchaeia archaeon]|jgi:histidyl-tRNA synthetase